MFVMRKNLLLCAFAVSGFTGLIYESIWSQYLKLFLGHAAYAQTLVLVMFMGGLAAGSWGVARTSTRLADPLKAYVLVEALVGVMGISFHRVFVATTEFSYSSAIPALPAEWLIHLYKWLLAALLMLPQSVLLGATFPLISTGLIRRWPEKPGETLSFLYFSNSLGAAVGVLISGFVLIGWVGLPGTILTAGLLNLLLAMGVWGLSKRDMVPDLSASLRVAAPKLDRLAKWLIAVAFMTGAASFMYELGWIRMLSLVLGSATHSFELMLSAFILGLAFGGLFVRRRIEAIRDVEIFLGVVLVLTGCLAALTLPAYNQMFDFMAWALGSFTRSPGGYIVNNLTSESIAALVMVPATFLAGMTLPLLTYALMRREQGERAIGTVYAANTLGAIGGVLATVYLLMPTIGLKGVILVGAATHLAAGFLRLAPRLRIQFRIVVGAIAAGVVVFALVAFGSRLDPMRLASGVFRTGFATLPTTSRVTYLRDGKTATISLVEQNGVVMIATNGKPDATIQMQSDVATPDETTMVLAAAIPLSLHPRPLRVANIGFGSGLTTHTLLTSSTIQRLDSIEIEPFMVDAARKGFRPRISNVFEDPRSHINFEDAKTFFAETHEPYDLIVSEPSNPWVSGVASLFSDEFYGHIVQHLNPGGYFVQWLQLYETNVDVFASVAKALIPHFTDVRFYDLDDANVLIVASHGTALPSLSTMPFEWPGMRAELNRIGVRSISDLQQREIGDRHSLGAWLQGRAVPRNSDFFPFVDLNAGRLRYLQSSAAELAGLTTPPFPFQELISGIHTAGPTQLPAPQSVLARDSQIRRAIAVRDAISNGKLTGLDSVAAAWLVVTNMSEEECADIEGRSLWTRAAWQLSKATAPYLSPPEQGPIWQSVMRTPCYRATAGEQQTWAELFGAVGHRDAMDIVRLTGRLLQQDGARTNDERAYLTTLGAAASVGLGRIGDARALLALELPRIDQPPEYRVPLGELITRVTPPTASSFR
jgi:spermidine synthase